MRFSSSHLSENKMFKVIFVAALLANVNCQDTTTDSTCNQQPIIQHICGSSEFPAISLEGNNRLNVAQGRPGRIGPEGPRGFKGSKVGATTNHPRKSICLAFRIALQPKVNGSKSSSSEKWCLLNVF